MKAQKMKYKPPMHEWSSNDISEFAAKNKKQAISNKPDNSSKPPMHEWSSNIIPEFIA
jgi:hypothetical protein